MRVTTLILSTTLGFQLVYSAPAAYPGSASSKTSTKSVQSNPLSSSKSHPVSVPNPLKASTSAPKQNSKKSKPEPEPDDDNEEEQDDDEEEEAEAPKPVKKTKKKKPKQSSTTVVTLSNNESDDVWRKIEEWAVIGTSAVVGARNLHKIYKEWKLDNAKAANEVIKVRFDGELERSKIEAETAENETKKKKAESEGLKQDLENESLRAEIAQRRKGMLKSSHQRSSGERGHNMVDDEEYEASEQDSADHLLGAREDASASAGPSSMPPPSKPESSLGRQVIPEEQPRVASPPTEQPVRLAPNKYIHQKHFEPSGAASSTENKVRPQGSESSLSLVPVDPNPAVDPNAAAVSSVSSDVEPQKMPAAIEDGGLLQPKPKCKRTDMPTPDCSENELRDDRALSSEIQQEDAAVGLENLQLQDELLAKPILSEVPPTELATAGSKEILQGDEKLFLQGNAVEEVLANEGGRMLELDVVKQGMAEMPNILAHI